MPTPNDSVIHTPFIHPPHLSRNSHTTCPPDVRDTETEYDQYTMDTSREGQGSPGPASRQMESQQPSEPEPATPIDSNNDTPTSSKMPGTLTIDDHEDYLSSSSGEISESASHEPVDTVRPEAEQGEQRQQTHESPESSHEEHESLPPPSDIHGLPRVRPIKPSKPNGLVAKSIPQMVPLLTSSFLRPFSKFRGQQQSDKQVYQVEVELKYVDMAESTLCGFLKIEGMPIPPAPHPSSKLS